MGQDTIRAAEKALADTSATWISRRDAAQRLAAAARDASKILNAHRNDSDPDVRMAVERALDELAAGNAASDQSAGSSSGHGTPFGDLVRACAKRGEREVIEDGDGFRVVVSLKDNRKQTVYVESVTRKDGLRLVRVYTFCGEPTDDAHTWALRANMRLVQSAVGLVERDGAEHFALIRCFLDGHITKAEMHTSIKEIAHYGDWIEKKLTGQDEL